MLENHFNELFSWSKVAITRNKPQTTRNRISGIYTSDEMQVVFVDTPGIFKPHSKLDDYMDKASVSSLNDVDLVLFMVELRKWVRAINTLQLVKRSKCSCSFSN